MRKAGCSRSPGQCTAASMGPQLDSCGRSQALPGAPGPGPASMGPQLDSCGRSPAQAGAPGSTRPASMGPQLDSCGRQVVCAAIAGAASASMGPQLDSCGRCRRCPCQGRVHVASMGPQLDSCGRFPLGGRRDGRVMLQWGRNLTVAEGTRPQQQTHSHRSFNGAAT